MKYLRFSRLVAALIATTTVLAVVVVAEEARPKAAVTPVSRSDGWWRQRFEQMNDRVRQGNVDLIFVGDSITQGWEAAGKNVWDKHYANRNAVNLGINADRTQHVLWRLDHGNIEGISPKLAVLMIGTNNACPSHHSPEAIAAGVGAIVQKLRAKLPETKVLLLAIFPRHCIPPENTGEDLLRPVIVKTNDILAELADDETVFYLDIGPNFLNEDGAIPLDVMPDQLHISPKGYAIWAEAIEPMVSKLMAEK